MKCRFGFLSIETHHEDRFLSGEINFQILHLIATLVSPVIPVILQSRTIFKGTVSRYCACTKL